MKRFVSVLTVTALLFFNGCAKKAAPADLDTVGGMELKYAEQFAVDYCENGCSVVTIGEDKFLVVPEGTAVPDDTTGMTVIQQPVENIYVAASSAMDLFDGIDKLDEVKMTSTAESGWSLPDIHDAVKSGKIKYIGKYSSPDYESLVADKPDPAADAAANAAMAAQGGGMY